ncbi:MAG: PTS sugar transporter subunit IIC [Tepidanaerobacteraceae bacterium]|nr:PTS sugar transporter subunit IIC [Tepidanaerobacteraceae bacterium]
MEISLFQAILLGCWAAFFHTQIFYTSSGIIRQPLITGLVVGAILGDIPSAMIASAPIQLLYMGVLAVGGAVPTDTCVGTIMGVTTALVAGVNPEQAVVVALPVGLLANQLLNILYIVQGTWVHKADKAVENCDLEAISRYGTIYPFIVPFIIYVPAIALAVYAGADAISALLAATPQNILHALEVVGGVLPALGFAMTITAIGKKSLFPYFVGAFFIATAMKNFGGISLTIYAIVGAVVGYLHVVYTSKEQEA